MKITCSQSDLSTNLSLVSRAVPSRPTHPVLGNVLLNADEEKQRIRITAFDLSLGIQVSFSAQVQDGGTVTLPAKLLNDIVSRLPEGELTLYDNEAISDEEDTNVVTTLSSASGRFQLRGMNAEEFPDLPIIEDGEAIYFSVEALSEGVRGTLFAASTEETKQVLTGIHLTLKQENLEFAATDGHRLSVVENPNTGDDQSELSEQNPAEEFEVTIPARALRELERLLNNAGKDEVVTLRYNEGQVIFELGDCRLTSRKLEGAYPAYHQLIPNQFQRQMSVERRRLVSALELVAVIADQKNNLVKFSLDSDTQELALSVDAKEVGNARQSLPAQISGDSVEILFNIKYLMDGLKALSSTEIQMQSNTPMQPVVFNPLGGLKMTYLVMPVQQRS
jgi:DNA polymerase-3 subunit beta